MPHRMHQILLVEDDLPLSESLRQFLGDHGYRTATAATARQAWESIHRSPPRLCLLDLNLPDGSGLDILRKIEEHRLPVRVVVMTAFDLHRMRPGANGALAGWMTKPVNPEQLLEMVRKALDEANAAAEPAGHTPGHAEQ
jgi:two-component system, NtrC family, response regulator PilR